MFKIGWTDADLTPHQFEGDAHKVQSELAPFVQSEEEWKRLRAFLASAETGDRFEEPGRYSVEKVV